MLQRGERGALSLGEIVERRRIWRRERWHQVNTRHVLRILLADTCTDAGSPVAPLCAVALVAQLIHQLGPGGSNSLDAPARLRWLVAKAVARQRRADNMEGVSRLATVRRRVG